MKRMRLVSVLIMAAFALSAVAASSAAARPNPEFEFHGSFLPPVEVSIKMPSGSTTFFYYHGLTYPVVQCEVARGHGEILNVSSTAHIRKVEITYEECRVPSYELTCEINGSKLHGSLKIVALEGPVGYYEPASADVLLHMKSSSNEFTGMEFTGTTCPLYGAYKVTKGVIGEIPGVDIGTSLTLFNEVLAINSSTEQLFKEIEDSLTTTVDELKVGTTPLAISGELEFTLLGSDSVTIKT
jgi:hypothetical protein